VRRLATLIWLRHRLWWNGLRSKARAADTVLAVILGCISIVASAALAAALAFVLHFGMSRGDVDAQRATLLVVFWMVAFLAVGLPLVFGSGQRGLPLERLLGYPVSPRALYLISLGGSAASGIHLFWYPVILVPSVVAVVVVRLPAVPWIGISLALAACLVAWCHAVLLVVQRLLRKRRLRELAALIGLVVVVAASIIPALIDTRQGGSEPMPLLIPAPLLPYVERVGAMLPPTIATEGVMASMAGDFRGVISSLAWLFVWTAAGVVIGSALFGPMLLGGGGGPRARVATARLSPTLGIASMDGWSRLNPACRAVAARELLYLSRSIVGKFNVVIMPLFVVMMGLLLESGVIRPVFGIDPSSLLFVSVMIYASMFSNNFLYNAYAWEGAGIRSYFISPVTARQVVVGKNVGLWTYNLLLALECVVSYAVVVGPPHPSVIISGCLAFAAALLASTTVGNFVSPALPVARDISKIGSTPSQTGVLVSFAMLLVNTCIIGGLLVLAAFGPTRWLQPAMLLLLMLVQVFVYRASLEPASRLFEDRREFLIEASRTPA